MVQLKKKVTIKTKTAQEETPVAVTEPEKEPLPVTVIACGLYDNFNTSLL